jgi:hypothetical protein
VPQTKELVVVALPAMFFVVVHLDDNHAPAVWESDRVTLANRVAAVGDDLHLAARHVDEAEPRHTARLVLATDTPLRTLMEFRD